MEVVGLDEDYERRSAEARIKLMSNLLLGGQRVHNRSTLFGQRYIRLLRYS